VQFYLDWFLDAKLCKLQNIKWDRAIIRSKLLRRW
jgi:hypothetical protein